MSCSPLFVSLANAIEEDITSRLQLRDEDRHVDVYLPGALFIIGAMQMFEMSKEAGKPCKTTGHDVCLVNAGEITVAFHVRPEAYHRHLN